MNDQKNVSNDPINDDGLVVPDLWRRFFVILQSEHIRGCSIPDHSICLTPVIENLIQAVRENKAKAGPGTTLGVNASEQMDVEVILGGF